MMPHVVSFLPHLHEHIHNPVINRLKPSVPGIELVAQHQSEYLCPACHHLLHLLHWFHWLHLCHWRRFRHMRHMRHLRRSSTRAERWSPDIPEITRCGQNRAANRHAWTRVGNALSSTSPLPTISPISFARKKADRSARIAFPASAAFCASLKTPYASLRNPASAAPDRISSKTGIANRICAASVSRDCPDIR